MRKIVVNEKIKDFFLVLSIIATGSLFLFLYKTKHAINFINLDELLWMYRSRFFIDSIFSLDFSHLIQSYHPGIMVMWVIGPFMKLLNYDFNLIVNFIASLNEAGIEYNIINDNSRNALIYSEYKTISFFLNIPIFSVIVLFIFSLYHLLGKLAIPKWAIIFSLLLVTTTPYYIYFTTPTDKFLGIFSTLSILSLLVYSSKKGSKKYLIYSAVFGSWAVLTKLSALFLIPFSLFILFFYERRLFTNLYSKNDFQKILQPISKIISDYLAWIFTFLVTSVIFFPTILTNPQSVKTIIVGETSKRIVSESNSAFSLSAILQTYLFDPFILSFNLFVILIFIIFLLSIIKKIITKKHIKDELQILIIYFFSFFLFIIIFSKIYSFRYLVPILIIFQIISGIGLYEITKNYNKIYNIKKKEEIYWWTIIFILVSQGLIIHYTTIETLENLPYFG